MEKRYYRLACTTDTSVLCSSPIFNSNSRVQISYRSVDCGFIRSLRNKLYAITAHVDKNVICFYDVIILGIYFAVDFPQCWVRSIEAK